MLYVPVVIIAVVIVGYAVWRDRQAVAVLRRIARERNLRFSRHDVLTVHRRFRESVLMRLGHAGRVWNTIWGNHRHGMWLAATCDCDVGSGGRRVAKRRVIAGIEAPSGIEAVSLPTEGDDERRDLLRTPLLVFGFERAAEAPGGNARRLYTRGGMRGAAAALSAFGRAVAAYPPEWAWEITERWVLVAAEASPAAIDRLLDAVAAVADALDERGCLTSSVGSRSG
jgi:hypothetical protein